MKRILFFTFSLLCVLNIDAQILIGDMNDDGNLDISDVTASVNTILGKTEKRTHTCSNVDNSLIVGIWVTTANKQLNLNEDGTTDLGTDYTYKYLPDVQVLLVYDADNTVVTAYNVPILDGNHMRLSAVGSSTSADYYKNGFVNHEYVNLGLPSGTLWATCNIGADSPEQYGQYFAWGETESQPDNTYNFGSYKWTTNQLWSGINKYQFADEQTDAVWYDSDGNFIGDNKTELDAEDDAATVNWGEDWRVPSQKEMQELIDNTTSTWTTLNGVYGRLFTSNIEGHTNKSIFLPAAGFWHNSAFNNVGPYGLYWTRSLDTGYEVFTDYASYMNFSENEYYVYAESRNTGFSIRPVIPGTVPDNVNPGEGYTDEQLVKRHNFDLDPE